MVWSSPRARDVEGSAIIAPTTSPAPSAESWPARSVSEATSTTVTEEPMPDRSDIGRILATNRYLVLGTADEAGQPWVTPVFFAPLDADRVCWVSSPDSRHSRNIANRAA